MIKKINLIFISLLIILFLETLVLMLSLTATHGLLRENAKIEKKLIKCTAKLSGQNNYFNKGTRNRICGYGCGFEGHSL